jgi:PKD repeat protein
MEYNHYLSDDNQSKEDLIEQDDYFIQKKLNEEQPIENKDLSKESQINQIIPDECFEKAFNQIFDPKSKDIEYENEEDFSPPVMNDYSNEIKDIGPCQEEKTIIKKVEENEDCYPFTQGKGVVKTLEKIGLSANFISNSKINLTTNVSNQIYINSKFKIIDYYIDGSGKKKKQKKKRKFKPDDIRKKIKARFHKVIKNIINSKLKKAGSKKLFDFFPQSFITNITIKLNNNALNLTYEKLIEKDYTSETQTKRRSTDLEKYAKNMDVLNYLKENPEICENSEFEKLKNMKYIDILRAYFSSMEFEDSIVELYNKKEKIDYIEEYVNKALTYVNFFADNKKINNIKKMKDTENISNSNSNLGEEEEEEDDSGYECE